MAEGRDVKRGIALLSQNMPDDGLATFTCRILCICDGNEEMAVHYLEVFGGKHCKLGTEEVRRYGEELAHDLRPYRRQTNFSLRKTFVYLICRQLPSPDCAMECAAASGPYEILCDEYYLWWFARKVCQML